MLDVLKGTVTQKDWAFVGGIIAVSVGVFALFYFFIYASRGKDLDAVNIEVAQITKQLKEAQETKKNIDKLRDEELKMETLVAQFEKRLPEEREIPELLRKFEALGDQLGLRVELVTLPTASDTDKETIPYKVTARGNFHQIVSFINLLERDERYLKVSDLDIGEEQASVSEAVFTLSTFRFIQPLPAPEPATPAKAGAAKAAGAKEAK